MNDFEANQKIFCKKVQRVRKGEQATDVNGQIFRDGVEVRNR